MLTTSYAPCTYDTFHVFCTAVLDTRLLCLSEVLSFSRCFLAVRWLCMALELIRLRAGPTLHFEFRNRNRSRKTKRIERQRNVVCAGRNAFADEFGESAAMVKGKSRDFSSTAFVRQTHGWWSTKGHAWGFGAGHASRAVEKSSAWRQAPLVSHVASNTTAFGTRPKYIHRREGTPVADENESSSERTSHETKYRSMYA